MFDLFRSRDKAVRMLLGGLLLLVALSMLTYLIPSYNTGGDASDVVVAEIGKDQLTLPEVQRSIQMAVRSRQMPPEMVSLMVPQLIEQMITERALAYQARRMGFEITDADVATSIKSLIPTLWQDGRFLGNDAYAQVLAQQNLSIPEFETNLRRELLVTRLRQVALEGIVVTQSEIEQEYHRRNDKVKIDYVKLSPEQFRTQVQVTPEELRKEYETKRATYQIPEKQSLDILVLDQSKLEASLTPSDAELQKMYDQNKDRFRTPERVKVRHILLKTEGKPKDEEAKIKAKAEDLLKKIKAANASNFAELAKQNSEDPGSAAKGGELSDWVTHGQTVPEFDKAAFSLKPNEVSDLVKTQYGYHIIQLLAKEPARLKPFEEAKSELATEWKKQRTNELTQQAADRAESALRKDPAHPEQVAAQFNMQVVKVQNVASGDPLPEIGVSKDFETSVGGLKKGEVSQPVALPGNKLALAVVTGVTPAHQASFEEVQNQVRDAVVKEKLDKLVADKANELLQKVQEAGGDLKKAAQSMKLTAKTSDDFSRMGAVEGVGSAGYVQDAFAKPVGTILGPLSTPDAKIVVKVIGHTIADPSGMASQRDTLRDEIKSRKARDRNALFEDGVRQALVREGKIKIHQEVVNRLAQNYRG